MPFQLFSSGVRGRRLASGAALVRRGRPFAVAGVDRGAERDAQFRADRGGSRRAGRRMVSLASLRCRPENPGTAAGIQAGFAGGQRNQRFRQARVTAGPVRRKATARTATFFKLSALKIPTTGLSAGARRAEFLEAIKGHVLAEAQYLGRFERA